MIRPGRSFEDRNSDTNTNGRGMAHEVSEENRHSIGNWASRHSCYILAKKLFSFFPCPKNLYKAELEILDRLAFRLDYHSPISSIRESKHGA